MCLFFFVPSWSIFFRSVISCFNLCLSICCISSLLKYHKPINKLVPQKKELSLKNTNNIKNGKIRKTNLWFGFAMPIFSSLISFILISVLPVWKKIFIYQLPYMYINTYFMVWDKKINLMSNLYSPDMTSDSISNFK